MQGSAYILSKVCNVKYQSCVCQSLDISTSRTCNWQCDLASAPGGQLCCNVDMCVVCGLQWMRHWLRVKP